MHLYLLSYEILTPITKEGWRLSPAAYDLNPDPDSAGLSLNAFRERW